MSLYTAEILGASPLRLQLDIPILLEAAIPENTHQISCFLWEYVAFSEVNTGGVSWPRISRAAPFSADDTTRLTALVSVPRNPATGSSQGTVWTNFSPDDTFFPTTTSGLPINVRWQARTLADCMVSGVGQSTRLTAESSGAHTWGATLLWEEK